MRSLTRVIVNEKIHKGGFVHHRVRDASFPVLSNITRCEPHRGDTKTAEISKAVVLEATHE